MYRICHTDFIGSWLKRYCHMRGFHVMAHKIWVLKILFPSLMFASNKSTEFVMNRTEYWVEKLLCYFFKSLCTGGGEPIIAWYLQCFPTFSCVLVVCMFLSFVRRWNTFNRLQVLSCWTFPEVATSHNVLVMSILNHHRALPAVSGGKKWNSCCTWVSWGSLKY